MRDPKTEPRIEHRDHTPRSAQRKPELIQLRCSFTSIVAQHLHCAHEECARGRDRARRNRRTFDNSGAFVLDITFFSTIIYIWYEDGQVRPFLEVDS
jgi:hypothetical protein